jgi:hypothetical protein
MANAIEVSDSLSNAEEHIERAAKVLGRGLARPLVFEEVYRHKKRIKTADEISERIGLHTTRVLQEGQHLFLNGIVRKTQKAGRTAYEQIPFFQHHKRRILSLARSPGRLAEVPTKRKTRVQSGATIVTKQTFNTAGGPLHIGANTGRGSIRIGSQQTINAAATDAELQKVLRELSKLLKIANLPEDLRKDAEEAVAEVSRNPTKSTGQRLLSAIRRIADAVTYSDKLSDSAIHLFEKAQKIF